MSDELYTSLMHRICTLESEITKLTNKQAEQDKVIAELRMQVPQQGGFVDAARFSDGWLGGTD